MKYCALPSWLLTKILLQWGDLPNHPWKVPGTDKMRFNLAQWASGRTSFVKMLDATLWTSCLVFIRIIYLAFK